MQPLHHRLEFVDLSAARVARVGREETDRVITPVIPETFLDQSPVVNERMDRHQFDRANAEALQMRDYWLGCQPRIGSPQMAWDVGMATCEALYVEFINDGVVPRGAQRAVVSP